MLIVPAQANPNQAFNVTLGGQQVQLEIFQTNYGLFMNVTVAGAPIVDGVICEDLNLIVREAYSGFSGDLIWFDTTGKGEDPVYTGLGDRFLLIYLEASDLSTGG
jgi:hypothetical protein